MLGDHKCLEKLSVFSVKEEDFYAWTMEVEKYESGVFSDGAWSFVVRSEVTGRGHCSSVCVRCA